MSVPRRAPRAALIVDHPLRDLAGLTLLAQELCQRGVVCHLVPMNLQEPEIWALRPDFVLLNFLRRGANEGFAGRLRKAGIRFGLLDTEGGVWPSEAGYAEILWEDRGLLHEAGPACMWGPRLADYVVREGLLAGERVRVTGCARFDLYHPRWRDLLGADAADRRPRVLVNTNYYTANGRFLSPERNRAQLEKMGWTAERARETVEAEAAGLEGMIALCGELAGAFPAATLVVRPHPFESPAPYRERLGRYGNVEINDSGSVAPQLKRASAVVQRSCTTAIEAALAGVPALSPRWIPTAAVNPMAEDVSIACDSAARVREVLAGVLAGRAPADAELDARRERVLHDWFYLSDGLAHRRVGDAVAGALEAAGPPADAALCRRYLHGIENGGSAAPFGSRLRHALRISPNFSFARLRRIEAHARPEKTFTADEVDAFARQVAGLRSAAGDTVWPVTVARASDRGDYHDGFRGQSVTLAAAGR